MIKFLFFSLLFIPIALATKPPVHTVIDYLRGTPAFVGGSLSLDQSFELYQGKRGIFNIGMRVNPRSPISYSFNERYLRIATENGISLTIQGVPIKVKEVSYSQVTGKFDVKTSMPFGLGEKTINSQIESFLNEHYRPKVIQAFNELKSIRSKQSLHDVNEVIGSISKLFSTESPMPTFRGNSYLAFNPSQDTNLRLDSWRAEIKRHDVIMTEMDYVKTPQKLTVNQIGVRSNLGVRISGRTRFPEIASINFKDLKANGRGITFNYDIGAEEVLAGFQILVAVIGGHAGNPRNALQECDPVRLESIRRSLDENLRREIALMIRHHRRSLISAGASPELLAALD
jgi:hypothetical protein